MTLTDAATGGRRDIYLGEHGTDASRRRYAEVLAEWEAAERVVPGCKPLPERSAGPGTVTDLAVDYFERITRQYGGQATAHVCEIKAALKLLRGLYGKLPAAEFGPLRLREIQQTLIGRGLSRRTINGRVNIIRACFKHGVATERIPAGVFQALECVPPVGKADGVGPGKAIKPVAAATLDAVLPHLTPPVRGVVQLMRYTGARCGEICSLTPGDIEATGKVWRAELRHHKNAHRGKPRVLWFGPKAQAVLRDFLHGKLDEPMFRPVDADADLCRRRAEARKTPESCGNKPGSNRVETPRRKPGKRYSTEVVRRAIERACERAGVDPFSPHGIRKLAATEIRREGGLEAASIVLGHSSATVTDATYAARDESVAINVIARVG